MPLLSAGSSVLLVVDLQERLMPAIAGAPRVLENAVAPGAGGDPTRRRRDHHRAGSGQARTHRRAGRGAAAHTRRREVDLRRGPRAPGRRRSSCAAARPTSACCPTVLALRASGHDVAVVADAVGSRSPENRDAALARMRAHGVDVVTTEMVVFEWLGSSRNPAFREVQALIK